MAKQETFWICEAAFCCDSAGICCDSAGRGVRCVHIKPHKNQDGNANSCTTTSCRNNGKNVICVEVSLAEYAVMRLSKQ